MMRLGIYVCVHIMYIYTFFNVNFFISARDMIVCDYCGDWYHYDCVGIDDVLANGIDTYKCQACISKGMDELMYEEDKFEIGNVLHTYKLQNGTSTKESP